MPTTQACKISGENFEISDLEISLRKKFGFDDLPNTAPWVRFRELGAFWQHWNLHNRQCDFSGKKIISVFSEKCPYPVWHKDDWVKHANPSAQDFDFSRPFFNQAWELFQKCPIPHNTGLGNENCEYTDDWWYSQNCYLCHSGVRNQDLQYCYRNLDDKDSFFNVFTYECELGVDNINSLKCFNCRYVLNTRNCQDSAFLYDCRNCRDCMFCFNQRNKQYCFGNVQYSKEEYQKKIASWNLSSRKVYDKAKVFFAQMMEKNAFHRATAVDKSENCRGDILENCKNCQNTFFMGEIEDAVNMLRSGIRVKDALDCMSLSQDTQLVFRSVNIQDNCYQVRFSFQLVKCRFMDYSENCFQCEHCFGCAGLVGKKYHIFNKPYSPEQYEILKNKIIAHMKKTGEWRRFFPGIFAPNPYDESWSSFYWTLSREEQQKLGFRISEISQKPEISHSEVSEIPDRISLLTPETYQSLLKKVFWDTQYSRPFKISQADIEFSRKMNVPLSDSFYMNRLQENFRWMPFTGKLRLCECAQCQKNIETSWDEKYSKRILCEECYREKIL